jgi:EAL domain-containing protein (putative c-di-GMP-specific phosphodiesterase class I)
MLNDPVDAAMVEAIHRIGRVMGKQTIAESVETVATLDALRSVGVDYAQGNAIAPPSMFAPPGTRSRHAAERGRSEGERVAPSAQRAVLVSRVSHDRTDR